MAGFVHTVLGKVKVEDIGITLTHEHLSLDYRNYYVPPPPEVKEYLDGEINLRNVGFIQRYPYSNKSNISFFTDDLKSAVLNDLNKFKKFGGCTIVENTTHGLKRDLLFLKKASEVTGVNIIAGTGFYLASCQPNSVLNKTVEEIYELMKVELTSGCPEAPEIKCGIIGEIASDYPIHAFEAEVIKATGMVQEELMCPVTFHPGRNSKAPFDIMRLFTESGGNPSKAIMSHLDRTLLSYEDLLNFSTEFKCFLQHDLFGTEVLTYQFHKDTHMPSDFERIKRIKMLIENGFLPRILISQDIHTKHRLRRTGNGESSGILEYFIRIAHRCYPSIKKDRIYQADVVGETDYGGHGYCHVLCNIIPKMRSVGFHPSEIDDIVVNNPKKWLSWNSGYLIIGLMERSLIR